MRSSWYYNSSTATIAVMSRVFIMRVGIGALFVVIVGAWPSHSPLFWRLVYSMNRSARSPLMREQFPVTVDPKNKAIVENAQVNAFLEGADSPLQAAAINAVSVLKNAFAWIAVAIADAPWYQSIAAADGRFVNITPGMRKEQVVGAFANALAWSPAQKKNF